MGRTPASWARRRPRACIAASTCRCCAGLTPRSLAVFDFAEQGMVTGSRDTTTVAPPGSLPAQRSVRASASRWCWPSGCSRGTISMRRRASIGPIDLRSVVPPTTGEIARTKAYLADFEAAASERARSSACRRVEPVPAVDRYRRGRGSERPRRVRPSPTSPVTKKSIQASSPSRGGLGQLLPGVIRFGRVSLSPVDRYELRITRLSASSSANRSFKVQYMLASRQSFAVERAHGRFSRRQALRTAGAGFGYLALAGMLGANRERRRSRRRPVGRRSARAKTTALSRQGQADHLSVHARRHVADGYLGLQAARPRG